MKLKVMICWIFAVTLWSQDNTVQDTQEVVITDGNFKEIIAKGFVVVKFTAKWSDNTTNGILPEVAGYQDALIFEARSEDTRKVSKKLRLRNFPSVALFYKGDKIEVWKGDMDGVLELTSKELKKEIDGVLAGDVF